MMELIVKETGPVLRKTPTNVVRLCPGLTVKRAYVHYPGRLTVGKINLWRASVKQAMMQPEGMFTMFRKPL